MFGKSSATAVASGYEGAQTNFYSYIWQRDRELQAPRLARRGGDAKTYPR